MLGLVSCLFVCISVDATTWHSPYVLDERTMPSLVVSLEPPREPLRRIEEDVRRQEEVREREDAVQMKTLRIGFRAALARAEARLDRIISKFMQALVGGALVHTVTSRGAVTPALGFLMRADESTRVAETVNLRVVWSKAQPRWNGSVSQMLEQATAEHLDRVFGKALAGLSGMLDVLLNTFEARLKSRMEHRANNALIHIASKHMPLATDGLLNLKRLEKSGRGLPAQGNVRIGSAGGGDVSVSRTFEDMFMRASTSERLARLKVFEMEMQIVKRLHRSMSQKLSSAVAKVMA